MTKAGTLEAPDLRDLAARRPDDFSWKGSSYYFAAANDNAPPAANDNDPPLYWPMYRAFQRGLISRKAMEGANYHHQIHRHDAEPAPAGVKIDEAGRVDICAGGPGTLWQQEAYLTSIGRAVAIHRYVGPLFHPWHAVVFDHAELSEVAPRDTTKRLAAKGGALRINCAGEIVADVAHMLTFAEDHDGELPSWAITLDDAEARRKAFANEWARLRYPKQEPPAFCGTIKE